MKQNPGIILLYPKTGWDIKNVTSLLPLSLLYLIKPLKKAGFEPTIIDQRIDENWKSTLKNALENKNNIAMGISAMTGLQIRWGLQAAGLAREKKEIPIIWGGIHPTLLPGQTLSDDLVDYIVSNEGEGALPKLLRAIADSSPVDNIPGVGFFKDGKPQINENSFLENLDDILFPDYTDIKVPDYLTTQTLGIEDLAITTSRGCPNRCSYCYNIPYNGRRWRAQSASAVVEHIRYIQKAFGVKGILIKDDNFFVSQKRVMEIAKGLSDSSSEKVIIRGECRADYIARHWEPEFLAYLAGHGFREMTVGAESGSDKTLETLRKDITVDDIRKANRRLGKAKIAVKFTFMAGYPGESVKRIKETLGLMLELIKENKYARVTPLHLYAPYPGTELFNESEKLGYRPPDSLNSWADVNFHELKLPWLSPKLSKKLEKASVATYFLDGRTVPEYFSRSLFFSFLAGIYGFVVRFRAKRFFFAFMPEIRLFEWVRKIKDLVI